MKSLLITITILVFSNTSFALDAHSQVDETLNYGNQCVRYLLGDIDRDRLAKTLLADDQTIDVITPCTEYQANVVLMSAFIEVGDFFKDIPEDDLQMEKKVELINATTRYLQAQRNHNPNIDAVMILVESRMAIRMNRVSAELHNDLKKLRKNDQK